MTTHPRPHFIRQCPSCGQFFLVYHTKRLICNTCMSADALFLKPDQRLPDTYVTYCPICRQCFPTQYTDNTHCPRCETGLLQPIDRGRIQCYTADH